MLKNSIILFLLIFTTHFVQAQSLQLSGNGIDIRLNDDNQIPNSEDGTLYGDTPVSRSRTHTFTIYNSSGKKIHIENITLDNDEFKIEEGHLKDIKSRQSKDFDIIFKPKSESLDINAQVSIFVGRGRDMQIFNFIIKGSGTEFDENDGSIMISQYYNSQNTTQIEVKNMSEYDLNDKEYFIAYFKSSDNLANEPRRGQTIDVRGMTAGAVEMYQFKGKLKGDEIIVISTDKKKKCYEERVDIIGSQTTWGNEISMTKGSCASEIPHVEFDIDDWLRLETSEVNTASILQNIHLGTYYNGNITWIGNKWTNGGLPDRSRTVIIEGDYNTDMGDIESCDLIVRAELNFRKFAENSFETNSVIVHRNLEVSSTGKFKLGNKMSLVMYDDEAEISGEIIKYEKSTKLNNPFDFTYWSSPVKDSKVENVFSGVRTGRVYYFDQSKTTASDPDDDPDGTFWDVWVPASGAMKQGRGYASEASIESSINHQVKFKGEPNNGIIYEQVHYNNDENPDNDFNLIGNPYPSAINIDAFFDANDQIIDPVVYLWTHSTPVSEQSGDYSFNDYATYNKTGGTGVGNGPVPSYNIGSSQGFLVRSIAAGQVMFNNSIRLKNDNDQFFKRTMIKKPKGDSEKDRIWLDLTTNKGGFNQILIGFDKKASDAYDSGYDALKFEGSNKIGFYSVLDSQKLTIQGLAAFNESKEIMLGFDTQLGQREYSIKISGLEGQLRDADLILYDHLLNISHDLEKSAYTFVHNEKGSFPGRFSLRLGRKVVIEEEEVPLQEELIISNQEDVFSIVATNEVSTLNLFDLQGRLIMRIHPNQKSFDFVESESRKGEILLLEIQMKDQKRIVKKTYKQ